MIILLPVLMYTDVLTVRVLALWHNGKSLAPVMLSQPHATPGKKAAISLFTLLALEIIAKVVLMVFGTLSEDRQSSIPLIRRTDVFATFFAISRDH